MRKTLMVITAITSLLVIYPSAYLLAGSPSSTNQIHIITSHDQNGNTPGSGILGNTSDNGGGDSKGDADDLGGLKYGDPLKRAGRANYETPYGVSFTLRAWLLYFLVNGLF